MSAVFIPSSLQELDGLLAASQLPVVGSAATTLFPTSVTVDQYGRVTAASGRSYPLAIGDTVGSGGSALLKSSLGVLAQAAAGTDFVAPTGSGAGLTGLVAAQIGSVPSGILKGSGGAFAAATANSDYLPVASPIATGTLTAPTVVGGSSASGDITVKGTSHATQGRVFLNGATCWVSNVGVLNAAQVNVGSSILDSSAVWASGFNNNVANATIGMASGFSTSSGYSVTITNNRAGDFAASTGFQGSLLAGAVQKFAPQSGTAAWRGLTVGGICNTGGTFGGTFTACFISPRLQSTTGATSVLLLDCGTNTNDSASGTHTSLFSFSGSANVFLANSAAVPSTNPSGGVYLYVEAGALKCRGSSGTVTTLAPA